MANYLCISVTLLDSFFHGKADHGEAEWPPSPLRLFQAMLRGGRTGCHHSHWTDAKLAAFKWLEQCEPPVIIAPKVRRACEYKLFVPNNDSDKEFDRQNRLTSKVARPHRLPDEIEHRTLHYLWRINDSPSHVHAEQLRDEARHLLMLGWGIDQAVATGRILTQTEAHTFEHNGVVWRPLIGQYPAADARRVPIAGTLDDLEIVYESFINSVNGRQYTPPLKPSVFDRVRYIPPNFVPSRPYAVFELRHDNGSFCRYPQRELMKMAGMMRCVAREAMEKSSPLGVSDDWVGRYVMGHRDESTTIHRQFSYLPLPSIGSTHADQAVRRVMIAAPVGDDAWLEHLAARLAGRQLKPKNGNKCKCGAQESPTLVRVRRDTVAHYYTRSSQVWHSVTPIILPGHDDHKRAKTKKLIDRALAASGIVQPCEYEWSTTSRFRKSFSAHKYDRRKRPTGYLRPDHLLSQTAVHLTIRFKDAEPPGPIVLGAGRHYGFGLMANPAFHA